MELQEILASVFGMKNEQFTDLQTILELDDFDSMNHMVFISQLEEAYKIELSGDDIMMMNTIGGIKKILLEKGVDL